MRHLDSKLLKGPFKKEKKGRMVNNGNTNLSIRIRPELLIFRLYVQTLCTVYIYSREAQHRVTSQSAFSVILSLNPAHMQKMQRGGEVRR